MNGSPLYLQPGRIGSLVLPNRLVRAATSETMATPEGVVSDSYVELYRRLAEGGVGLILTGHMYVDARGQATANQAGIHHDGVIPALRRATGAVHAAGGRIFAQLGHCGSQTMMSNIRPVAPSPVPNAMYGIRPQVLAPADIEALVRSFGEAARRAAAAGFDGVHIHGGNGYLISEFCSPHANTRTDGWGGDARRRSRFHARGVPRGKGSGRGRLGGDRSACRRGLGAGRVAEGGVGGGGPVSWRERGIDGFETTYGVMRSYLENIRPYVAVQRAQAWRNLVVQRLWKPAGAEAYYRPFARAVKQATGLPVILVGGIRTTGSMIDILDGGDADFLAMARPCHP